MAVLASLGCGHLHDLARASLQHHVAVLAQGGALHRISGGGARLATGEVKIGICHDAKRLDHWRRQWINQLVAEGGGQQSKHGMSLELLPRPH